MDVANTKVIQAFVTPDSRELTIEFGEIQFDRNFAALVISSAPRLTAACEAAWIWRTIR
jgi:hypothetical protein